MTPELTALLAEAKATTTCAAWALQMGWKLRRSGAELVGPCPKCGGVDRFAINVAKDVWLCRNCSVGGDVVFLVQHVEGLALTPALERITGRGLAAAPDPAEQERLRAERERQDLQRDREAERYRERARADAHALWKGSLAIDSSLLEGHVLGYLKLRGVPLDGTGIDLGRWPVREHAHRAYWHNGVVLHTGEAMVAAIQLPDNRFGGIHMTYLDLARPKGKLVLPELDGKALPAKKVLGIKKGGAIRLLTPSGARRMVMGEGIETTLTPLVHARDPDTAYWAGIDLGNMAGRAARSATGGMIHDEPDMADDGSFLAPDWVEELVYLCDGDEPEKRTVEKVTRGLRRQLRHRAVRRAEDPALPALRTLMVPPGEAGTDLNSLVMAEAAVDVNDEGIGGP